MRILLIILMAAGPWYGCKGQSSPAVGGGCDGCELMFEGMPERINAMDTSIAWKATDRRMVISGTVYQSNGKIPAGGTIVYYYHTNREGRYAQGKAQVNGKRHGELRGWVKTDANGNYKIFTCVPGAYPNRDIPAHVHMIVKEPGINEYYIDDIHFDDDPLLTTAVRRNNQSRGGSGVIMTDEKSGVTYVERNITLGLHIPNYPVKDEQQIASGLSVGENCPAFDPIHFSGPDKGKTRCPMCSYGFDQGVIIWWNDINTETLVGLLKKLDPIIDKYGFKKLRVFVVYMNPERKVLKAMTKDMTSLATKSELKNCALTYIPIPDDQQSFDDYQLNLNVKNTIMIYRKRKVIDKFVNYQSQDLSELLHRLSL
jgi:protocatechuate 3,4-dioxygenase, beta subunit